jgi:hypothetical protein
MTASKVEADKSGIGAVNCLERAVAKPPSAAVAAAHVFLLVAALGP